MSPWQACLDALAEHLVEQRAALADGRPEDVHPFAVPDGIGPVPAALAGRLRALAAENAALSIELTAAVASCARQLQVLTVFHRPEAATAAFVDSRS